MLEKILLNTDLSRIVTNYALLSIIMLAGIIVNRFVFSLLKYIHTKNEIILVSSIRKHLYGIMRLFIPILLVFIVLPTFDTTRKDIILIQQLANLGFIALLSLALIRATYVLQDVALNFFTLNTNNNLQARKIHTQLKIGQQILIFAILVIAISSILMTFENIRQLGVSILASAGLIGIIVGIAAQRSVATLFAGIQIAFTQPIRIDDVVIIEKEWGRIEEITLTYVVVAIWDKRRLIVPITYFMEKPFENWTRNTADILGTVIIPVDYTIPVETIRQELHRILQNTKLWDGKVWSLQVTNSTDKILELRALMSAPDSSTAWDLRCHVREKLITYIQNQYPQCLPKRRNAI